MRLLPDSQRLGQIFRKPHFLFISKEDAQGMLLRCWKISSGLESEPEAKQVFCFTLLRGSETKRLTLPEPFNDGD